MKQEQFAQEQIKNMFKVCKRLHSTFRDVRKLTKKYLRKMLRLRTKKKLYQAQIQKNRKKQQIEKKKKQKTQQRKIRKQKQNVQKEKEKQKQNVNAMIQENQNIKPQQKSIISIINQDKIKLKSNRPKQNKQEKPVQIKENKKIVKQNTQKTQQKSVEKKKTQKQVSKQKQATNRILEKPIEPESPYYRFLRMKKNEIKSTILGDRSTAQTMQIMKSIWEKMRDEEKRQYVQSYQIDKAKYERDLNLYYKQNEKKEKSEAKKDSKKNQKEAEVKDPVIVGFDFIDELYK